MDPLTAALLGCLIGIATGLLPGLHVNTIAAVGFAIAPAAGPTGAILLLAVGTVHTVVNILPATYLGAPDEDDVVAVLPAHRLLLSGRGADAVTVSVSSSLIGATAAVLVGLLLHHRLTDPVLWWIDAATPLILVAVILLLWLQEARTRITRLPAAMLITTVSGLLGWYSTEVPLRPLVSVAPSVLLPLLSGLFGAAGLSIALQKPPLIPWQRPLLRPMRRPRPAIIGTVLASLTALMPGLTAAVATAMVPGIRGRPLHALAAMSAINTAHAVLAIIVLLATTRVRTGLADALNRWAPTNWNGAMPTQDVAIILTVVLAAAIIGALATIQLDRIIRPRVEKLPSQGLAAFGLIFLAALVLVLTGLTGFLLFVVATMVGRMPLKLGVRRVHLIGCLIVPALLWRLGF